MKIFYRKFTLKIPCLFNPFPCTAQEKLRPACESALEGNLLGNKLITCQIDFAIQTKDLVKVDWIRDTVSEFSLGGCYGQFSEAPSWNHNFLIRLSSKENFEPIYRQGIFRFSSYQLSKIDTSKRDLNQYFNWKKTEVKKATCYRICQLLRLKLENTDSKNGMKSDISQPCRSLSSGNIKNSQSLYGSRCLSVPIAKGPVSANSIVLKWNTTNPDKLNIRGPNFCWSKTNIHPTRCLQEEFL